MVSTFFKRLNEPFPSKQSLGDSLKRQIYISLFIAAFLFFFKPFGMRHAENPLYLSLAFGLVSFLFSLSFDLFCRYVLKIRTDLPSWTLFKWLLYVFLLVSWIAFGNYVLQAVLFWGDLGSFALWLQVWKATLLLGCFPIVFSGLVIQMRAVQSNLRQAQSIELPQHVEAREFKPKICFENGVNDVYECFIDEILLVEAMQNYVQLTVIRNGKVERMTLRQTISSIYEQFQSSGAEHVLRCHRSYLVNLDKISQVSGNAQGLKLSFDGLEGVLVPVSRSYIAEFKHAIANATRP